MRLPSLLSLFFASTALAALPYKGVDWSSLLVEEQAGKQYKNSAGQIQPLETILKNTGVNTVRQRIWVNPSDGNYNLDYNIKLAKRAKAAGLKIYLDFHYSDNWADPGKQIVPAAWKSLNRDALIKQIYDYTKSVLNRFQTEGIALSIVSIGNEITPGLLWPIGQLSNSDGPKNVAALLKSASKAVKESSLSSKPKIMIHLDNGFYWGTQVRSPFLFLFHRPMYRREHQLIFILTVAHSNGGTTSSSAPAAASPSPTSTSRAYPTTPSTTPMPTWAPSPLV